MKRARLVLSLGLAISWLGLSSPAFADVDYSRFSAGFELNEYQGDFAYGVNVTSPFFLEGAGAVRASVTLAHFSRFTDGAGENHWLTYPVLKIGFVGGSVVKGFMRMYGYGGALLVFPNKTFSAESTVVGGFGAFGFEFLSDFGLNYFIELGATGTGARAEKLPGKPIYANGFMATVGMRYYF